MKRVIRKTYKQINDRILEVLSQRAIGQTMCPSEALDPSERQIKSKMDEVRQVAAKMAQFGKLEILQRGKVVNHGPWTGPIRLRLPKSAVPFAYKDIDFRKNPECYRIARGEQGVLVVEPYKSELLPLWRFKTVGMAEVSSKALFKKFEDYKTKNDFVGMDMARKFIQMGFTRSRRYANHRSGKKYIGAVPPAMKGRSGAHGRSIAPLDPDLEKAEAAKVFKKVLHKVESTEEYKAARLKWKKQYG